MKTSVALVASLEVVTEALWAETEALKPEAEARPRRLKILSRRDRGEALEGLEAASRPRRRDRGHIPRYWQNVDFVQWVINFIYQLIELQRLQWQGPQLMENEEHTLRYQFHHYACEIIWHQGLLHIFHNSFIYPLQNMQVLLHHYWHIVNLSVCLLHESKNYTVLSTQFHSGQKLAKTSSVVNTHSWVTCSNWFVSENVRHWVSEFPKHFTLFWTVAKLLTVQVLLAHPATH